MGLLDHIGRACRQARKTAGLRQLDIATELGRSHATISRFESGQDHPRNLDQVVAVYARETGRSELELWTHAIEEWKADNR